MSLRCRDNRRIISVILPGAVWLAMPKCPLCLAASLALFTGLGVSTGFAVGLRILVISLTITAIFLFALGLFRNYKTTKP